MSQPASALRFPLTIFLSAFLLFQVQPIIGRYVLPWFGGGPAVWTNCMLFFQALLLAGYAYAHWLGSRRNSRFQSWVHISLLAASLLFLPIGPQASFWKPTSSDDPSFRILLLLTATVGGPYFLLSSTGPLLQHWYALSQPAKSPWRFYALSNLGSFLALLTYPFAIEPFLRLRTQSWMWSVLYLVFVGCCGWTAWRFHRTPVAVGTNAAEVETVERPSLGTIIFWLGLSACSSTVLLATTNQICQEIAVNPFLWVAPLSIYLFTFVLTFDHERWYHRTGFAVAAGIFAPVGCAILSAGIAMSIGTQLILYFAVLFIICMVCHGELALSRPSPRYLTAFYLTIAAGGALGGVFVALVAPHVFVEFSEYPIGLAAACLLGFLGWIRTGALKQWTTRNFAIRVPLMALLIGGITAIVAGLTPGNQTAIENSRNFYGILRVVGRSVGSGVVRELTHGRIVHGFQYQDLERRDRPTSYFGPHGGAGMVINALTKPNRRVAVVGLGTGTLAAYGRPGDTFRFYEINPAVERIAQTWFSYLKDSHAHTEVVLGDARIQMESELAHGQSHDFDLIAVDAFSSDSIPVHLLTEECADIYRQRLGPDGLLLLHISNRILNLDPVARGLANHLRWKAIPFVSPDHPETGESSAFWVLITPNSDFVTRAGLTPHPPAGAQRPALVWTDDFASLWHVVTLGSTGQ